MTDKFHFMTEEFHFMTEPTQTFKFLSVGGGTC